MVERSRLTSKTMSIEVSRSQERLVAVWVVAVHAMAIARYGRPCWSVWHAL